jgi:hypothetical protein
VRLLVPGKRLHTAGHMNPGLRCEVVIHIRVVVQQHSRVRVTEHIATAVSVVTPPVVGGKEDPCVGTYI